MGATETLAKRHHIQFIDYCWIKRNNPFLKGPHTKVICETIDESFNRFDNGESVFYIIQCPFRHGKTDIISRYLPPHFLGKYPDNEILVATYGANLAGDISRQSRNIIKTDKFRQLYTGINISKESASVENWALDKHAGMTHWTGVGGASTGKGYHLGIIDDYLKNREDAESQTIREKQWEWFTDVFLTRRAPVSITIILATPWHVDDIAGRIKKKMEDDPDFPKFNVIKFPAFSDDYPTGTLFPDRFDRTWYDQQKASLGTYGTASLLQCEPIVKGGNLLKTGGIKIIDPASFPFLSNLKWVRAWDLASTEKQLLKSDPDYTAGCLMAMNFVGGIPHIYIKNIRRLRQEAPERNRIICQCADMDGPSVRIGIESVAGFKDTYTTMKDILNGKAVVQEINVSKDKITRAGPLEPIFEAGNVYLFKGEWNYDFIEECSQFPGGTHDDQVDALICGYEMQKISKVQFNEIVTENKPITHGLMDRQF